MMRCRKQNTVELQWLEHDGSFLSPLEKCHSCRLGIIKGDYSFYLENGMLCVLIRIALMRPF